MKVSYNALRLLRHVLTYTGEIELNQEGKEVPTSRRLNGEESSQRNHFRKNSQAPMEAVEKAAQAVYDPHNEKVKVKKEALQAANPKREEESDSIYESRINALLNEDTELKEGVKVVNEEVRAITDAPVEVEVSDKTKAVLKKYFEVFGNEAGYGDGDDNAVSEVTTLLA